MKLLLNIIYKAVLFTSPLWIFVLYLEFRLGQLDNSYSFKIRNFNKIKDSCEILVLGNSQMLKGVNPDLLPGKAYNMANVSQNFEIEEAFLKKYISEMPKLKTVIIGLCYTSFGETLKNGDEKWRMAFYKKNYGIDIGKQFDMKEYSNIMLYQPYEALKIVLKNFKVDLTQEYQANGWVLIKGEDTAKLSDTWAKERAGSHTKGLNEKYIRTNSTSLQNMITLLQKKGIQVNIVCPPVQLNYQKHLNPKWLAINDGIMRLVEKRFDVKIMDYSNRVPVQFKNGFNDVDHLNEKGARQLSLLITDALKNQ